VIELAGEEPFGRAASVKQCSKDIGESHDQHVVDRDSILCQMDLSFYHEKKKR
jgi:hypothetical protein